MSTINTVPVSNYPKEIKLELTLVAQNQEDEDYIKNELVSHDLTPFFTELSLGIKEHKIS